MSRKDPRCLWSTWRVLPVAASILGTVPAWLTVAAVVIGAWLIWKGGGGTALGTLQTANRILERRVRDLEAQSREDAKLIAELQGKTDMALAVQPFMAWAETHEARAEERLAKTLVVLDLIAAKIGPEAHTE
jgi:hypothetical protein